MRRPMIALAALVLVATGCGVSPSPDASANSSEPILVEGGDAGFLLAMQVGSGVFNAGAPIDIAAQLTWTGAAPSATIWGSGGGPVSFGLKQLDGDLELGPAMTADCRAHEFARGVPVQIPYRKSGGFSADDKNAEFYRAFFADPVLRLPAGQWRVTAGANGHLMPCDANAPSVDITVAVDFLVR